MALKNLRDLYSECMECTKCPLHEGRNSVVFGEGNLRADIMFVGEGPGKDEDLQGRPFVGRAGQLLDKLMAEVGLKREEVYIANIVKCRPPGNRVPTDEEAEACLPYLRNQVAIIAPKIIVCLGATAMKYIIDRKAKITQIRGNIIERKGVYLIPTFHPAAILRDTSKIELTRQDFKKIVELYHRLRGEERAV
ncbi:DNA polymerase [Caldanaerobius fijiensis DSM 17918]|uniref:Type-4 uracil-DNA glycosylase n=1 Tax=Caldanaerobius fijiensis DSM 17918 TaxID=1121256 RepID=A0A1M4X4V3_9THEO|nr:uracil-DNA glycosylase [Caldanaerobius fijiensis]SHE88232.1 DNA polymerase [Caldanaerobius fijiensis DSM 17918]